jgi:class 3 adenylate cyclase
VHRFWAVVQSLEGYSAGATVEGERVQRRLAAILAADVAGYSRLTGADEEGTIARLRALRRELIDVAIEARGGRSAKTAGDGTLIEFPPLARPCEARKWYTKSRAAGVMSALLRWLVRLARRATPTLEQ